MQKCGGVLVPPDGQNRDAPRETWIRVCRVVEQPDRVFDSKQLVITEDHWWPQEMHDAWNISPEQRLYIHMAHMHCQNHQGGRIKDIRGIRPAEVTKAKMSAVHRGNQNALGYKHTDEAKSKISEASIGNTRGLGLRNSDETKSRKSTSAKARWARARSGEAG